MPERPPGAGEGPPEWVQELRENDLRSAKPGDSRAVRNPRTGTWERREVLDVRDDGPGTVVISETNDA